MKAGIISFFSFISTIALGSILVLTAIAYLNPSHSPINVTQLFYFDLGLLFIVFGSAFCSPRKQKIKSIKTM